MSTDPKPAPEEMVELHRITCQCEKCRLFIVRRKIDLLIQGLEKQKESND